MAKVGRQGVVTMEESKTAEDNLVFVEGMQFDRGYYSPYFVTDPERMVAEYENCRSVALSKVAYGSCNDCCSLQETGLCACHAGQIQMRVGPAWCLVMKAFLRL